MPLLSDATNCFVGHTQIKQIYAGSHKVWPKPSSAPSLPSLIEVYDVNRANLPGDWAALLFSCSGVKCIDMFSMYYCTIREDGSFERWPTSIGEDNINPGSSFFCYLTNEENQFLFESPFLAQTQNPHRIDRFVDGKWYIAPEFSYTPKPWPNVPEDLRENQCT